MDNAYVLRRKASISSTSADCEEAKVRSPVQTVLHECA